MSRLGPWLALLPLALTCACSPKIVRAAQRGDAKAVAASYPAAMTLHRDIAVAGRL